jgi:NADH dehydrogenase [ubiquinone] 1 alpha subcomplex assembly factor 7
MVAHEFFDALPIHAFQLVDVPSSKDLPASEELNHQSPSSRTTKPTLQWRELMVSPTLPGSHHSLPSTPKSQEHESFPEFQLTLSPGRTRHSLYLPETSLRYRKLKAVPDALIEICPDAALYISDFATRIGGSPKHPKPHPSGAALILDYGPADTVPVNSLRGIRRHRRVNPFSEPGLVDLSADVDFAALAESATKSSDGVEVHGPVEQGEFLNQMGIKERAEILRKHVGENSEKAARIERAWKRLVDCGPGGMGKVYKALAILPENEGKRQPVGFGGDLAG